MLYDDEEVIEYLTKGLEEVRGMLVSRANLKQVAEDHELRAAKTTIRQLEVANTELQRQLVVAHEQPKTALAEAREETRVTARQLQRARELLKRFRNGGHTLYMAPRAQCERCDMVGPVKWTDPPRGLDPVTVCLFGCEDGTDG